MRHTSKHRLQDLDGFQLRHGAALVRPEYNVRDRLARTFLISPPSTGKGCKGGADRFQRQHLVPRKAPNLGKDLHREHAVQVKQLHQCVSGRVANSSLSGGGECVTRVVVQWVAGNRLYREIHIAHCYQHIPGDAEIHANCGDAHEYSAAVRGLLTVVEKNFDIIISDTSIAVCGSLLSTRLRKRGSAP